MELQTQSPSPDHAPVLSTTSTDVDELWQRMHADLVEWMTEGTHPYRVPRADHG